MTNILLLEDLPEIRAWLSSLVMQVFPDAQIAEAARVHDALGLVSAIKFDLALVDLGLPDGSGVDVVAALREAESLDAYSLLDAQDWMDDATLNTLWREITRTARPGARVIFRTAGEETILPGRVDDTLLQSWTYERDGAAEIFSRGRAAICGGVHLYIKAE